MSKVDRLKLVSNNLLTNYRYVPFHYPLILLFKTDLCMKRQIEILDLSLPYFCTLTDHFKSTWNLITVYWLICWTFYNSKIDNDIEIQELVRDEKYSRQGGSRKSREIFSYTNNSWFTVTQLIAYTWHSNYTNTLSTVYDMSNYVVITSKKLYRLLILY
jgi:hypothetical protein